MDFTSERTLDNGLRERRFTTAGADGRVVPGVLWTRPGAAPGAPLVLIGHGGSGHKDDDGTAHTRDAFTLARGIATAAIDGPVHGERGGVTSILEPAYAELWKSPTAVDDMVTDWTRTLDALLGIDEFDAGRVGYHGLSMGTLFGLPLVAAEPRIRLAVLGLCGFRGTSMVRTGIAPRLAQDAPRITCPVYYHVQWDDERFDRDSAFELYGMLGSTDKRLQSTPGLHAGVGAEARDALRGWLADRLLAAPASK